MLTTIEKLIAARNLKPKKKEGFLKVISAFSFLGIMLGVAILIIVMSVMNGFRTELTDKILGFNSHISIKPYAKNITKEFYSNLEAKYKNTKIIMTYEGEAVVMKSNSVKGILIRGLETRKVGEIDFFRKNIIDGNLSNFVNDSIIIGKYLAIELGVVVGDTINIMSSSKVTTPMGLILKQSPYKIAAVFSSGLYEFDRNVTFLNLEDSLSFFDKTNENVTIDIFLKNPLIADKYKNEIQKNNPNFNVNSWSDLNKSFFSALKVERNVMFIILMLILIVAAFNIISGLTILIKNKTKEIAILKTLGLSNRSIRKTFFLTGLTIGFFATISGIFFGVLFSLNIEKIRIFLSKAFNLEIFPSDIYFLDELPSEININSILIIFVISLVISAIASYLPARKISKMNTFRALRYE